LCFFIRRVTPIVPALAPAKALRSGALMTTRRRSSRASRAATGEPSRDVVVASGSQQEKAAAVTAAMVMALSALVPTVGDRAMAMDVTDDHAPPPDGANGETGPYQLSSLRRRCW
jgi:hypothetical protein